MRVTYECAEVALVQLEHSCEHRLALCEIEDGKQDDGLVRPALLEEPKRRWQVCERTPRKPTAASTDKQELSADMHEPLGSAGVGDCTHKIGYGSSLVPSR